MLPPNWPGPRAGLFFADRPFATPPRSWLRRSPCYLLLANRFAFPFSGSFDRAEVVEAVSERRARCSFCGKVHNEVRKLIAGPTFVARIFPPGPRRGGCEATFSREVMSSNVWAGVDTRRRSA